MKKSVHQNPKKYWWNRKSHDNPLRLRIIYRTFVRVISYKTQHFAKKIIDKQLCSPINKHLSAFVNFKKHLAQNPRHTYFKIVKKAAMNNLWSKSDQKSQQKQSIWAIPVSQIVQTREKRRVPPLLGSTHLRMQPEDAIILMPIRKTIGSDKYLVVIVHT